MEPNLIQKKKRGIHAILSESYITYLALFMPAFLLDMIIKVYNLPNWSQHLGYFFIFLGPVLIYWAQHTSANFIKNSKGHELKKEDFMHGPYKFSRSPTHLGLTMLIVGLALITNSPFALLATCASYIITIHTFICEEENILEEKYGEAYHKYRVCVGNKWI